MDPFALLGVSPDVTPDELTAAYRRLAKEWHPDHQLTAEATWRMAQINAAYDQARAELADGTAKRRLARAQQQQPAAGEKPGGRKPIAPWLEPRLRKALGPELGRALHDGEPVLIVSPASTWASPQARLAVTDRRLLWLNEDAITDRVRSLRFDAIDGADHRLSWPRRRTATVRVRDHHGRRTSFAEIAPATAAEIVGLVQRRRQAA